MAKWEQVRMNSWYDVNDAHFALWNKWEWNKQKTTTIRQNHKNPKQDLKTISAWDEMRHNREYKEWKLFGGISLPSFCCVCCTLRSSNNLAGKNTIANNNWNKHTQKSTHKVWGYELKTTKTKQESREKASEEEIIISQWGNKRAKKLAFVLRVLFVGVLRERERAKKIIWNKNRRNDLKLSLQ